MSNYDPPNRRPDVHITNDYSSKDDFERVHGPRLRYVEVKLWIKENLCIHEQGHYKKECGRKKMDVKCAGAWNKHRPSLHIPWDVWENAVADAILLSVDY